MLKPKKGFLMAQLNVDKLTTLQFDGIMRAMDAYSEHYHENKVNSLKNNSNNSPLLNDDELKRLIWEDWEGEIKEEDPREMVFKYMKLMRSELSK